MASQCLKYTLGSHKLSSGPPARYRLPLTRVNLDGLPDDASKIRKFTLGKKNPQKQNRTVMFVGATGTGKSTLINALVNYVMGVKFEDKVWFEMIVDESDRPQSDSQTSEVSVYEVFGFEGVTVPYSLTIIDTPGYGDTRGMKYDDIVTRKLQELFQVPGRVDTIDLVGLVLKASDNRVDERMAYIFNSVTSLFAKDMENNIVIMMTFSDGMKPTDALQALKNAKIKCAKSESQEPVHFLFNNNQKKKLEERGRALRVAKNAYETSAEGMEDFTAFLDQTQPQSMKECVEVIRDRERLTACIDNLKERVTYIEAQQQEINDNREQLKMFEEGIEKNKDFTLKKTVKAKVKQSDRAITCRKCEENCHNPCNGSAHPWFCTSMNFWTRQCKVCSGKCSYTEHDGDNFIYVTGTVYTTAEEMKKEYDRNKSEHEKKTTLLEDLEEDLIKKTIEKYECLNEAFSYIEQLEKIALNADSVHTYIHLEFLIEKMEGNEDMKIKVKKLEKMKNRADKKTKNAAEYYKKSQ